MPVGRRKTGRRECSAGGPRGGEKKRLALDRIRGEDKVKKEKCVNKKEKASEKGGLKMGRSK